MSNTPIYPVYEQKMRDKIDELQSDNARLQSLTTEQAAEIERLKGLCRDCSELLSDDPNDNNDDFFNETYKAVSLIGEALTKGRGE